MSRKLLLSSIAIAATATLLGVGTYAKFSDKEDSKGLSFTAGTMDLQIISGGSDEQWILPVDVTNAKPGDAGHKSVAFHNAGSVDGTVFVKVVMDSNEENGIVEPETEAGDTTGAVGQGELGDALQVSISQVSPVAQSLTYLNGVAAPGVVWDASTYPEHILYAGHDGSVDVNWSIPTDVGNKIMTDSVSFHLVFTLEQV